MDNGILTNKGVVTKPAGRTDSVSRLMYDRRPLKTIALAPPDYKIPHHILTDSYLEKEVRFAGIVHNIPVDLDCTNRTDVLRVIDRGKQEKVVPWGRGQEQEAVFSLSVHNVKISRRDGNEELLLRLPIHEVAAACYIRDEDQHILAIKYGSFKLSRGLSLDDGQDLCKLAVLSCDTRGCVEELCLLIAQCFQLVYTDATMSFLDSRVNEAAAGMSIGSSTLRSDRSTPSSTPKRDRGDSRANDRGERSLPGDRSLDGRSLGFLTQSSLDLDQESGLVSRMLHPPVTRRSSTAKSDSELSATANEMIHDYMTKIYNKLNHEELRRFAMLVKAWHTNMAFGDFCDKVLELYGMDRKHLIVGMRPFIPDKDIGTFDTFLERIGMQNMAIFSETMTPNLAARVSGTYAAATYHPSTTAHSGGHGNGPHGNGPHGNGDEYDQRLNQISRDIDNLGTSIEMSHLNGETAPGTVPKTT